MVARELRGGNFLRLSGVGIGCIKNANNTRKTKEKIHMKDIFRLISAKANYVDPDMAKEFYFGLIKVIMAGIREDGEMQLPNFGTFRYVQKKPMRIRNIKSGAIQTTGIRKCIVFTPCVGLKSYIANMK